MDVRDTPGVDGALGIFLKQHRLANILNEIVELGVEIVDDLAFINEKMLEGTRIKPVVQMRLLEVCLKVKQGEKCSEDSHSPPQKPFDQKLSSARSSDREELQSDTGVDLHINSQNDSHIAVEVHNSTMCTPVVSSDDSTRRHITHEDGDSELERAPKARKVGYHSLKRWGEHMGSVSGGSARNFFVNASGRCDCHPLLNRIKERLPEAMLTVTEQKSRKGRYNYSRLCGIVLDMAFDASGNWTVHRKCIKTILPVSWSWLSDRHRDAQEISKSPMIEMKKCDIATVPLKRRRLLIENIIIPEDCILSPKQFFQSRALDYSFKISRVDSNCHSLVGRTSNRARREERERFKMFVIAHRQPTGRTLQSDGRSHGAMYYIDSIFECMKRKDATEESQASLADVFNTALRIGWSSIPSTPSRPRADFKAISASTLTAWLREDFGSIKYEEGVRKPSDQFTSFYPHKTDACAKCEILKSSIRSLTRRRDRFKSNNDKEKVDKQLMVSEVSAGIEDASTDLRGHRVEADKALKHHRSCVIDAYSRYTSVADQFEEMLLDARDVFSKETDKNNAIDKFLDSAMCLWVDISSDYQQDKTVPMWHKSPQPGPTYYMSGTTFYVHIICAESFGLSTGPTKYDRNRVYTRSEEVCGAKVCDDTLSTFCDVLLGYEKPKCNQPSLYRTGYDKDGELYRK